MVSLVPVPKLRLKLGEAQVKHHWYGQDHAACQDKSRLRISMCKCVIVSDMHESHNYASSGSIMVHPTKYSTKPDEPPPETMLPSEKS